ncbi:MAG TPA: M20/M25/M40 family metallo-hydrolase [Thermoanaerobaculia bacterium]|nr:M20/M25/M40 family metallo-hydrolase [Thermoanaerobaculia bacterium]
MLLAITLAATLTSGHRAAHEAEILTEFTRFLAIPNVASDTPNIERNAAMLSEMLKHRGVATQLLRVEGAPPVVFGALDAPGAKKTITFYAHYDGQPTVASDWTNGEPWTPVVRDGRIWARSASDDKAAIVTMLVALDAGSKPKVNLRFFFEGEEEAGSPHLQQILEKYAALLKTDAWMLCDGPVHQTGRKQIFYGARGVSDVEITVYGPARPLHSGHYGNWVPNPIVLLTHLLDSMRDERGKILVAGFYDDVAPPTDEEKRAIAALPPVEEQLRAELGIAVPEGKNLNEQLMLPALNLRGIASGSVGAKASNTIQRDATASIDFRLVPNQTPERVRDRIEAHVAAQGFHIVRDTPDMPTRLAHAKIAKLTWHLGYPASRTPLDAPLSREVADIVRETFGDVVRLPTLGGSIPMYLFHDASGAPVIGVPIANYDNNQHAPNENMRIDYFWDGVELFAALFSKLGR